MIRTCVLCGAKYQTSIEKDVSYCHGCLMNLFETRSNRLIRILSELTTEQLKRIVALSHMLLANTQLEQKRRTKTRYKLLKNVRIR